MKVGLLHGSRGGHFIYRGLCRLKGRAGVCVPTYVCMYTRVCLSVWAGRAICETGAKSQVMGDNV